MTARPGTVGGVRLLWSLTTIVAVLFLSGVAAHAWVSPSLTSALELRAAKPPAYDPTRITVKFRDGIDQARMADVVQDTGCSVSFAARFVPGLMDLRIPAGADFREFVRTYAARLDVEYAHPCYLDYPAFVPNDDRYPLQWHFQQIGMPTAWDIYPARGSSTVTVCVLDTGVAYENYGIYTQAPDLAGVTFVSPYNAVDGDGHPNDVNAHGTHVTGTIAQKTNNSIGVAGMADHVRIMPVRTLGGSTGGTHAQFSDGVHWATDHGAKIINYSGGGSHSPEKHDAVTYAHDAGVLFIAAMGNDGVQDPTLGYPGRYPEAMGVVAVDYAKAKAWYSNWGADADITGPGGDTGANLNGDAYPDGVLQQTYTTADDPTSGFSLQWYQGTSMATPHVVGLAALIWSQGIYSTRATVRSRIQNTAEDLGAAGPDSTFGSGLIRADRALSPWLMWAGTGGYAADGIQPNRGDPDADSFVFKAKYLDGTNTAPLKARCIIQRLVCGASGGTRWKLWRNLPMTLQSGTIQDGAIYATAGTTMPNEVFKYRFHFQTAAGGTAPGAPTAYKQGPLVRGRPHLCWIGKPGYTTDGVNPDSGPRGTKFYFRALYTDSDGKAPTTYNVLVRRNGVLYKQKQMNPLLHGSLRTGRTYVTSVFLPPDTTYDYRFQFDDGSGMANGEPATWQPGPDVGAGAAAVTALMAVPTKAGAQVTFSLADAADVTATVMNIAGRPIRTIAQDKALEAGLQTLLWDRKAASGLAVPAGLYLVKVTARSADGTQSSAMATMAVR